MVSKAGRCDGVRDRKDRHSAQPGHLLAASLRTQARSDGDAGEPGVRSAEMTATTKDQVWVSELNARPEIRSAFPKGPVRFYDTTLRDGEQTVGVVLSPQQKLEIARHLDTLGVSRIEAGFPRVSAEDGEAIQRMQAAGLQAELWGFSRAVDGTRTELEFLRKVYTTAIEAGAAEIVVVDTIGACGPEAVEFLVRQTREWVGPQVPVHFHGHNDFGMATACAVAAVRGGASWIQGTINGMGERAGNADICEIALALRCLYDVPVVLDLTKVREVSEIVQKAAGYTVDAWKPLVGQNLFMRESGAVASQFHMPEAIEPYSSELVSAERRIVLGKKSGLDSIDWKARELGIAFSPEQRASILAAVKKQAIAKRGLLSDQEFRKIVEEFAGALKH